MKKIVVYTHSDCLLKNNGSNHPEKKERLEIVLKSIKEVNSIDDIIKEAPLASVDDVCLVHPKIFLSLDDEVFQTHRQHQRN